jgi:hypothetical protein
MGIGMADLTTRRLMDKVDLHDTHMNALTSKILRSARLPITLENDKAALEAALDGVPDPLHAKMVRIRSTASLETFWATAAVLSELRTREGIAVADRPLDVKFDEEGKLVPFDLTPS